MNLRLPAMTHHNCLYLFLLFALFPVLTEAQQFLNLDFERLSVEGTARPWGWNVYVYAPGVSSDCDTTTSTSGGKSLRISGDTKGDTTLFEYVFAVEPSQLHHQRIDLNAMAKTLDFRGEAGIRLEAVGKVGEEFAPLTSVELRIDQHQKWRNYRLADFALDDQLHTLNIVLFYRGSGTVWFDGLELLVGGEKRTEVPVAPDFSEREQEQLQQSTTPLLSIKPSKNTALKNPDFSDLAAFKALVGDADIIALGESTHGTSEFFRLKHRLLQYAIHELGVRVFVLEDNQLAVEEVNNYVLYGEGSARVAMQGLFAVWNTQEMLAMIEWLRDYNLHHPEVAVEFVGMDVQNPGPALVQLTAFLEENAPQLHKQANSLLNDFSQNWNQHYYYKREEKLKWREQTETVYQLVHGAQPQWLQRARTTADSSAVIWAVQNANLLRQCVASILTNAFEGRDRAMAENVDWIRHHRPTGTKILIWAHDTHISRGEAATTDQNYHLGFSMGSVLAKKHGSNYRAFGLSTYSGTCLGTISYSNFKRIPFELYTSPAGSLDAELHRRSNELGRPALLLNLHERTDWLNRPLPVRYVGYVAEDFGFGGRYLIPRQFDGIFFLDQTTAAQPLE